MIGDHYEHKKITLAFIFFSRFVFTLNAENTKINICSELKEAKLLPSGNEILIAGEVFEPKSIKQNKFSFALAQLIAMAGGFSKQANIKEVQIIKCSSDFHSVENLTLVNFQKIKTGSEKDLEVKDGEIIYVPKTNFSALNFKLISSVLIQ